MSKFSRVVRAWIGLIILVRRATVAGLEFWPGYRPTMAKAVATPLGRRRHSKTHIFDQHPAIFMVEMNGKLSLGTARLQAWGRFRSEAKQGSYMQRRDACQQECVYLEPRKSHVEKASKDRAGPGGSSSSLGGQRLIIRLAHCLAV